MDSYIMGTTIAAHDHTSISHSVSGKNVFLHLHFGASVVSIMFEDMQAVTDWFSKLDTEWRMMLDEEDARTVRNRNLEQLAVETFALA